MKRSSLLFVLSVIAALLFATLAIGSLGESEDSIDGDCSSISGNRGPSRSQGEYTVHEVTTDAVTIREFADSSGTVFAVAWNGISTPDLTSFLGAYASECKEASKDARIPGRRSLVVKTGRVVMERWGHMRNLQGRAYVPDLVPKGVNIDEIR